MKKSANWATFFRTSSRKFVKGCQSCEVNDQRSIFRHYFFCKNLPFLKFSLVGAEIRPTPSDLFQQFLQNSFPVVRVTFWGEVVYFKSFSIYSKIFGKLWKHLFHRKLERGGSNCTLHVQKSNPKNFYIEYFDFADRNFVRISKPAFKCTRKTICRKRFSWGNFSILDRFFGLDFEISYFWGKIDQVVQACLEKQSTKTFSWTRK